MNLKKFTGVILFTLLANLAFSQRPYPRVGDTIVDHNFRDLVNSDKKSVNISDFRGKWLVLDFWATGCGTCIASFPKINNLNRQFNDRVKIISVGIFSKFTQSSSTYNYEKIIKDLFAKKKENLNLKFTCAFDSVVQNKYNIGAVPTILIIDPNGVIKAKTWHIDSLFLESLMNGVDTEYDYVLSRDERARKIDYNTKLPLLTTGKKANGGIDTAVIFRSVLTHFNKNMPMILSGFDGSSGNGRAEAIGYSIPTMFKLAYLGQPNWLSRDSLYGIISRQVIFEKKDSLINIENQDPKNLYAYSVQAPYKILTTTFAQKSLLADLEKTFQVASSVELRDVDVYNLIVLDERKVRKLKSKGGIPNIIDYKEKIGYQLVNTSIKTFIELTLSSALNGNVDYSIYNAPNIVDRTGINFNIDMSFDADDRMWDESLKAIRKNGFDLVKGTAKMKCIVIKDIGLAKK